MLTFIAHSQAHFSLSTLDYDQIFNLFEATLWFTISIIFCIQLFRHKPHRDLTIASAIAFFAFGISDLIEIQTRAWWQPTSLFIFKATCVLTLIIIFITYSRRAKKNNK